MRSSRDPRYLDAFSAFAKSKNPLLLIQTLQKAATACDPNDNKLRGIMQMAMQSKLFDDKDTNAVMKRFED